jgi:hypothetical protein
VRASARLPQRVTGSPRHSIGITTGVPQIAADLLRSPSRQSRAKVLNRCAIAAARLGRGALTRAEIIDSRFGCPVLRIEVSSTSSKTGVAYEYGYRQRMIEDMNARKLCAGTQRGHIRGLQAVRGVSQAVPRNGYGRGYPPWLTRPRPSRASAIAQRFSALARIRSSGPRPSASGVGVTPDVRVTGFAESSVTQRDAISVGPSGALASACRRIEERPCPRRAATKADQSQTCCTASGLTPIQTDGSPARDRPPDLQKRSAWCMIRARPSTIAFLCRRLYEGAANERVFLVTRLNLGSI